MRIHSVEGASTGSPREILQLGYKVGLQLFSSHCPARCFDMNMSKSRDAITEGDFLCILARNCEGTEQLRWIY